MTAEPANSTRNSLLPLFCVALLFPCQLASGETIELNNANSPGSYFLIATDTAGLLGFVGHRHAILAGDWSAELEIDSQNLTQSSIRFSARTDSLVLDSERAYRLAGFKKAIPPEKDRLATMQRIIGPEVLYVSKNPEVQFHSESVEVMMDGEDDTTTMSVSGKLQLRSDLLPPTPVEVEVTMNRLSDRLVFDGSVEILQSDFGLKPFSLAGIVKVQDQIRLVWHLEVDSSGLILAHAP